jgi:hypothetical protein
MRFQEEPLLVENSIFTVVTLTAVQDMFCVVAPAQVSPPLGEVTVMDWALSNPAKDDRQKRM